MGLPANERALSEFKWASHAARMRLSREDQALFFDCTHTARLLARPGSDFVISTFTNGRAEILDSIRLVNLQLSPVTGLRLTFERADGTHFSIDPNPSKLPGLDVFFWVPAFGELRWTPYDWSDARSERELRVMFAIRTRHGFKNKVEGAHYISKASDFALHNSNAL